MLRIVAALALVSLALAGVPQADPPAPPAQQEATGHLAEPTSPDRTIAEVTPAAPTVVGFDVPVAGNVSFSARFMSGTVLTQVEGSGMGACDGTLFNGVRITGIGVYPQSPGPMQDCGVMAPGPYELVLQTSAAAATVWLFIEGATWATPL